MTDKENNTTPEVKADSLTGKELTGKEKRLANLRPFAKAGEPQTAEEIQRQREISIKGGKARGEQMKKAKSLKELANDLIECRISRERAQNVLGELAEYIPDENLTNGALLIGSMLGEVLENKTTKAAEFIRDTSGQAPKMQIDATVETFSESDRALMDKIAQRLGILTEENDG